MSKTLFALLCLLSASLSFGSRSNAGASEFASVGLHSFTRWNKDDMVDLGPLFQQSLESYGEDAYTYNFWGRQLKCCCYDGTCKLGVMNAPNYCTGEYNPLGYRDQNGCGCIVGMGYRSFFRNNEGCLMTVDQAVQSLTSLHPSTFVKPEALLASVEEAKTTRWINGWKVSYGECSTKCGRGLRPRINVECMGGACGSYDQSKVPDSLECQELSSCEWTCEEASMGCGWGTVGCSGDKQYCSMKSVYEVSFPKEGDFKYSSCFKPCTNDNSLRSMCAVTANHLDEQYGTLEGLISRTCFEGADQKPDIVVLMAQELNHYGNNPLGSNDWPTYVHMNSLPGYFLAGECVPDMSANSAVFLKENLRSHIFPERVQCSGNTLRSYCDFTNCKGTSIMALPTTSGSLVVGNWHGARAGWESDKRVKEFEAAARYISSVSPFLNRKLVVFGGDVNVRSDFGEQISLDMRNELTPQQIAGASQGDILGIQGWTMDQHLKGDVGLDHDVKSSLQNFPLKQVKDWDKLCPTYHKADSPFFIEEYKEWDGTKNFFGFKNYVKKTRNVPNMKCRSPADQMADGESKTEFLDMARPTGGKSRAPSWTERIFLSQELFDSCGKAKKDIRNQQSDHDPMFVQCSIPYESIEEGN